MKFVPLFLFALLLTNFCVAQSGRKQYQCLPCGQACDNETFSTSGTCPHCQMTLVEKSTITFKTMSPETVCSYISSHPSAILLDVRTREEFEGRHDPDFGTLKGAINIPIQEIETRLHELQRYKNREIIVFCSHSHRSPQVSYRLAQNGFKKVFNMAGGMSTLRDNTCRK